jgi:beta-lactamase superfamily II metal-dependent hydrolase
MMARSGRSVTVRMYNVGFGDAFVVTVRRGQHRWRMLVDCGVHPAGQARPLEDAVKAIIADLAADSTDGQPHLDVIAATHGHEDHIGGFRFDAWEDVSVGEVWVPFVEDLSDPDARDIREKQTAAAGRLTALLDDRVRGIYQRKWPAAVTTARWFAANSSRNAIATDRLLGRNGRRFATTPRVRYLPSRKETDNTIEVQLPGVTAHVLGPPRDRTHLRRMNPPSRAGWLALDSDRTGPVGNEPLFNPRVFVMDQAELAWHHQLIEDHEAIRDLDQLNDDGLLAAASLLEQAVNNTSLFFVLQVGEVRLLFPGDAQQGAWDHVLSDAEKTALVSNVAFYKISHHGSHNGTPRRYVEEVLKDGKQAMLPWGLVKKWESTIPKPELLEALEDHHHRVIRADNPIPRRGQVRVQGDLWSELELAAP